MKKLLSQPRRPAAWVFALLPFGPGLLAARPPQRSAPAPEPAAALVQRALQQMGGPDRWRAVRTLRLSGRGHRYLLEQSERFEGPYIPEYTVQHELRDVAGRRRRVRSTVHGFGYQFQTTAVLTDSVAAVQRGATFFPSPATDAQEALDFGPETLLFTAAAAPDLRRGRDTLLQGVPHRTVAFTWRGRWPVRLFLNRDTGMLTGREITRPVDDRYYFQIWGDVKLVALYSFWTLDPLGVRYPLQTDEWWNGQYYRTTLYDKLELNVPAPADSFAVPAAVQRQYQAQRRAAPAPAAVGGGQRPAGEIAPGVYELPGNWDVTVVRQPDGLVILEAPISSAYSAAVIEKARQLYPGLPVKAVVTTSDAWPHFGGVREYAARGIPVYALDLNRPILEKLLRASFRTAPDAWQRAQRRRPVLRLVSEKTTLGQGLNRLEMAPVRSETGERMMLVYFPEHQLLYGSDLIQFSQGGTTVDPIQYASEVRERAEALGWSVKKVFAMHASPLDWTKIVEATEPRGGG